MFPAGIGLTCFSFDPLPDLACTCGIDEDDHMFTGGLYDLGFDLSKQLIEWKNNILRNRTEKGYHASLLGNGIKLPSLAIYGDGDFLIMVIPAQFIEKQVLKLEILYTVFYPCCFHEYPKEFARL